MIQIKLQERYYEYDIYSLVKAFYPKEEIHTVSDFPEEAEGEISFRLVVDFAPEEVAVTLYPGPGSAGQDADERNSGKKVVTERGTIDFSDQRDTKNRVKRILYHMLSERNTRSRVALGDADRNPPHKDPLHLLEEGRGEEEIADFMHETYLCSDEKTDLAISIAKRRRRFWSVWTMRTVTASMWGSPSAPADASIVLLPAIRQISGRKKWMPTWTPWSRNCDSCLRAFRGKVQHHLYRRRDAHNPLGNAAGPADHHD